MVYTPVLGTGAERHGGSSPLPRTNKSAKTDFFDVRKASKSICLREDLKTFDSFLECIHSRAQIKSAVFAKQKRLI
jgi:hypothetical protein